jgi:hypothetical protein
MVDNNIITIIITVITVLGSAGAWKFYDSRLNRLTQLRKEERVDENIYREDLRYRINNLEQLLIESTKENFKRIDTIILLTRQVATLETKVTYLEKENDILSRMK